MATTKKLYSRKVEYSNRTKWNESKWTISIPLALTLPYFFCEGAHFDIFGRTYNAVYNFEFFFLYFCSQNWRHMNVIWMETGKKYVKLTTNVISQRQTTTDKHSEHTYLYICTVSFIVRSYTQFTLQILLCKPEFTHKNCIYSKDFCRWIHTVWPHILPFVEDIEYA